MSCLLNTLGIFTALIAVLVAFFKWRYLYWKRKDVPYLEPTIPFGNLLNPLTSKMHFGEVLYGLYQRARSKGVKYCGFYFMATPALLVTNLDLVKQVMTKDFEHFTDRGRYSNEKDDLLNGHLFSMGGERWKNLRAKLTPTFTTGKLKAMFQTLVDCGVGLEDYIEEASRSNAAVDIKDVLGCFSTDVIGSCAFGLDCNSFVQPDSPFRYYGKKVMTLTKLTLLRILFTTTFPDIALKLGVTTNSKDVRDFFTKVVEDSVAHRKTNNSTRKDFLQLLIDLKEKEGQEGTDKGLTLNMREIIAQCFVFFIAGFETSSTTMTFALFELACNQDIQDKVRGEIKEVLGRHHDQMTYDSISELKYIKQVIDETLRMYSPAFQLQRKCVKDYKIPDTDVVIEKGTNVWISLKGIHYDEAYYDNPKLFDPNRFTEANKKKRHAYSHLPFGEGPRVCIGERFGIMQTKVGLTYILRKFRVTLNKKTKVPLTTSASSPVSAAEGGIWLNFEKI